MKQPHEILGVARDADKEAIKRAYLKLARTVHPDGGGSKEEFVRLQTAYEALMSGYTAPEPPRQTQSHRASPDDSFSSAPRKSFKTMMEEFQRSLNPEDQGQPPANQIWEVHSAREMAWTVGLTLVCAGATATWVSHDGQSWDAAIWTFSFAVTVVVLAYVGGVAAVAATTPMTNGLQVYRWIMALILVAVSVTLIRSACEARPQRYRNPIMSANIVPDWWPIQSGNRRPPQHR